MAPETGGVDPHILKAIAKAWSWRRKLETGAAATIEDIAQSESVTPAFIRRMLKLSYLAPVVLEKILIARVSPGVSLKQMSTAADLPWVKQEAVIFANEQNTCDAASGETQSPSAKSFASTVPQVQ
jgi:hypothetical protein